MRTVVIAINRLGVPMHVINATPDEFVRAWAGRFIPGLRDGHLDTLHELASEWGLLLDEAEFVPGMKTTTIEECLNDLD